MEIMILLKVIISINFYHTKIDVKCAVDYVLGGEPILSLQWELKAKGKYRASHNFSPPNRN